MALVFAEALLRLLQNRGWGVPVMETDCFQRLPDVPAVSLAREPAVQTDALGRIQDGETLYGTAAQLWGSARAAG